MRGPADIPRRPIVHLALFHAIFFILLETGRERREIGDRDCRFAQVQQRVELGGTARSELITSATEAEEGPWQLTSSRSS